jgi:hypothetical protein
MANVPNQPAELRARRIVLVDEAGVERIVLEAGPRHGSIQVRPAPGQAHTAVELYAVDAIEADGPEIGLALVVDGDVVDGLRVLAPRRP